MSFTPDEKINGFDLIAQHYFKQNFGTMSKTDIEILLFHIYIEHLLDSKLPFDDYTMSKNLGIPQSKIRNLKMRKELRYPRKGFDWRTAFIESIKSATYDDHSRLVRMCISDINVLTELRYFMEINGWYDEYHLNPKLFQCRLDFFVKLCNKLSDEDLIQNDESAEKLEELEKKLSSTKDKSAIRKILEGSAEDGIKALVQSASKELILEVLKLLPFGGLAAQAIDILRCIIEKA